MASIEETLKELEKVKTHLKKLDEIIKGLAECDTKEFAEELRQKCMEMKDDSEERGNEATEHTRPV